MHRVAMLAICMTIIALPAYAKVKNCPDLSGRYRVIGEGPALDDALKALHARPTDPRRIVLQLESVSDGELSVAIVSTASGYRSAQPNSLQLGTDFECRSGSLIFIPLADVGRKSDEVTTYEGTSSVAVSRVPNGELAITVEFNGGERATLFSYDSARISVPKPGTRTTIRDTLRWPEADDSAIEAITQEPPEESREVRDIRQLLTDAVLAGVSVGAIVPKQGGALVSFRVSTSAELYRFEERLRAASIVYETVREPIWSNSMYFMDFLIRPSDGAARTASKPSLLRIETEMRKLAWPLANLDQVERSGGDYLATVTMQSGNTVDDLIARIKVQSGLIAQVYLIDISLPVDAVHGPRAQLKLRVR